MDKWQRSNWHFYSEKSSNAPHFEAYLEWIDPHDLSDIQHLADGGYGSVYSAKLSNEMRYYELNTEIGILTKNKRQGKVALKTLHSSKNITTDFLTEVNFVSQPWYVILSIVNINSCIVFL